MPEWSTLLLRRRVAFFAVLIVAIAVATAIAISSRDPEDQTTAFYRAEPGQLEFLQWTAQPDGAINGTLARYDYRRAGPGAPASDSDAGAPDPGASDAGAPDPGASDAGAPRVSARDGSPGAGPSNAGSSDAENKPLAFAGHQDGDHIEFDVPILQDGGGFQGLIQGDQLTLQRTGQPPGQQSRVFRRTTGDQLDDLQGQARQSSPTGSSGRPPNPDDRYRAMPATPQRLVATLYDRIAKNYPDEICGKFTDAAAAKFAADHQAPDCPAAVSKIHDLGADDWGSVRSDADAIVVTGNQASVDTCRLDIQVPPDVNAPPAQPQSPPARLPSTQGTGLKPETLGVFALTRPVARDGYGWVISDYTPIATCPG